MKSNICNFIMDQTQLVNYIAVEIAEKFRKCPSQDEINHIEVILQRYLNLNTLPIKEAANI